MAGVRIDTLPTGGSLKLDGVAVTTGQVILAADLTKLVFTATDDDANASVSFTFSVQDAGGDFAATPNTFTINTTAVNDIPVGADKTIAISEGANGAGVASHTFVAADFGFTDADASNSFKAVLINSVPTGGVLALNGVAVRAADVIALADLSKLVFTATDNAGDTTASFTFSVQDENNAFSTAPATISLTIDGTNDAPAFTSAGTASFVENGSTPAYEAVATDADRDQTVSYSFGVEGVDNDLFTIDTTTGAVSFKAAPDFENPADNGKNNVYDVVIQATSGGETISKSVAITVTDQTTFTIDANGGTFNGTGVIDEVKGRGGDDIINGAGGDDDLFGGAGDDVINGGSGSDQVFGEDGDDTLNGSSGNDILTGGGGNDIIDGGSQDTGGADVAVFSGNLRDYTIVLSGPDFLITDNRLNSPDGTDTVRGVEQFRFADGTISAVQLVNDAPVAVADTLSATEDTVVTFTATQLLGNDTDADSDALVIQSVTEGTGGTVAIVNGAVVFTPTANFNGPATFTYTASDGRGGVSAPATVTVNVAAVNDVPVNTVPSAQTLAEDASLAITGVSVSDVDGGTLTTTLSVTSGVLTVTATGSATITNNASGTVTVSGTASEINAVLSSLNYKGAADFNGADELKVVTTDGTLSDTDTVAITVTAANDAPVNLVPGAQTVAEDASLAITGVSVSDVDGGTLTTTLSVASGVLTVTATGSATITNNASGTVTVSGTASEINAVLSSLNYKGTADFNGSDELKVVTTDGTMSDSDTVAITVSAVNDAPVLTGSLSATVAEGGRYVLTATELGYTDADVGDDVTFTVTNPTNGTVQVGGQAVATFTGAQLTAGLVSFVHGGGENLTASFSVSVEDGNEDGSAAVAQPFTVTVTPVNDAPVNTVPVAQTVAEDASLAITGVSVADVDSTTLTTTLSVASGVLTVTATGAATITGNASGTVTVSGTASEINAVLSSLNYKGALNFNGADELKVVTTDDTGNGSQSDTDTVVITVTGVNDAPVAVADTNAGAEDTLIIGSVATNDSDTRDVTVGYTVTDGNGGTKAAQLVITVTGVNDAPVAVADTNAGAEDTLIIGSVATNDSDVDGDTLTYTVSGTVPPGFVLEGDGSYVLDTTDTAYQDLGVGETRDVTVGYTVTDGNGGTKAAQLVITVTGVNDAPVAVAPATSRSATP
ncbi:hypothetical protein ASF26_21595 [Methylobacterium sp. Leaf93]|nr:hypothetical protein ASF26_21595 [Methylobacterium sp. Leaf93]